MPRAWILLILTLPVFASAGCAAARPSTGLLMPAPDEQGAGALLAGFLLGLGWTVTLDGTHVAASRGDERLYLDPVLEAAGLDRVIVTRAWPPAPGAGEAELAAFARELNEALNVGQFLTDRRGLVLHASLPFLEELDPRLLVAFLDFTADVRLAVLQVQGERALLAPVEGEQASR
jgi:hypothetical protein